MMGRFWPRWSKLMISLISLIGLWLGARFFRSNSIKTSSVKNRPQLVHVDQRAGPIGQLQVQPSSASVKTHDASSVAIAQSIFPLNPEDGIEDEDRPRESKKNNSWRNRNQEELIRLLECGRLNYQSSTCTPNDHHIVLLGTVHFSRVVQGLFAQKAAFPAGEGIWADALLWALKELKYPYLIVDGPSHYDTNARLGQIYEALGGKDVSMVIGDYLSIPECLRNSQCSESRLNPGGIPAHKLFVFDGFGQDVGHPLGRRWHLTFYPKQSENFTYMGLTIEHYCHRFGVTPPSERYNKIYVLGKDRGYFHPPSPQLYSEDMWTRLTNLTGIEFTIGTTQKSLDDGPDGGPQAEKDKLVKGITDIGSQTRDGFIHQIQHHRAIIGLGWPVQPSTPLEGLCVGTPFINPVWVGRRTQPDRSKWHCQHPYLAQFDAPYVYNVQDHHEDDVLEAIHRIMKEPLTEAFIPEEMKSGTYLKRIEGLIRTDWKALSELEGASEKSHQLT